MKNFATLLMGLAVVAVILAIIGAFAKDIWLAPTQWLLVAAVLGIAALLLKPKK